MDREKRTLAEGEATGHAHVLDASEVSPKGDLVLFDSPEGDVLRHEEHDAIAIPSGSWVSGRVLEYDHFAEEAKTVVD